MPTGHSEKWHADRATGIGGSDIAGILGLDRYSSPMRVYLDKIGVPSEVTESEAMEWGTRLEAEVAAKFAEMHPEYVVLKAVEPDGEETLFRHRDFGFAVAHPDRMLAGPNGDAVWECKTVGREARKAAWTQADGTDYPPPHVLAQVQWYVAVTDAAYAWVSALFEGRYYREWRIERDPEFIAKALEEGAKFWELVETRTPPPIDASEATSEVLAILYRETVDEEIELAPEYEALAANRLELKARIADLQEALNLAENELKAALGEHETGHAGPYRVTWKTRNGRRSADVKALEADGLTQYVKQGAPYRVFDVRESDE